MLPAVCFNLDQSKILLSGNGLNLLSEHAFNLDEARNLLSGKALNMGVPIQWASAMVHI